MKQLFIVIVYLLLAEALEFAVLVQLRPLEGWMAAILDLRLLALSGILWGLWRGEIWGLGVGMIAALLFGFSQSAGQLGASIVSFTLVGFVAGMLARNLRARSSVSFLFWIFTLLVIERLVWCGVRWGLGISRVFEIQWSGLILTALIGTLLFGLLKSACRVDLRQSNE